MAPWCNLRRVTAKLIEIVQGECRRRENGVRFRCVFRVTGFASDILNVHYGAKRHAHRPVLFDFGMSHPTMTPIEGVDPAIDEHWVMVCHHRVEARKEDAEPAPRPH